LTIFKVDFFVSITEKTITRKIAELIEDEGLRNELRAKGYDYMRKYHDSEQIMERLLELYGD